MNAASTRSIGPRPAWKRVRFEAIALAAMFLVMGAALVLISLPFSQPTVLQSLGIALMAAGALILLIRPWSFMRRMEMQILVHRESLTGLATKRIQFGHADAHWHHQGEEWQSPGVCEACGMLRDEDGRCRRCDERKD